MGELRFADDHSCSFQRNGDLIAALEKKRRQNCLRQRAWRERQRILRKTNVVDSVHDETWQGYGLLKLADKSDSEIDSHSSSTFGPLSVAPLRSQHDDTNSRSPTTRTMHPDKDPSSYKLIPPILSYTSIGTTKQSPHVVINFPLSPDHCLITLVQYNVVRALLFNMSILSMMDNLPLGCGNSLQIPNFGAVSPDMIPFDLRPSALQNSTPHLFWIDAIPFPKFRDNLILKSGTYDSDDLFYDLVRGIYEGFDDIERRGYLVWGDSWSSHGWEISEGFLKKWGSLLTGCADLIDSTNYWREIRGEDILIAKLQ